MHLRFCGINYPPYMLITDNGNTITGILYDFLVQLSISLNFTFTFRDLTATNYEIKENSSFIELIMMVHRGECQIMWSPGDISYELSQIVDFSVPLFDTPVVILSAGPKESNTAITWNLLSANPMIIACFFGLMVILAFITFFFEHFIWKNSSSQVEYFNLLWHYYGSIFMEPFPMKFGRSSSRLIIAFWWICVVIIVSVIGGNLKANLSVADRGTIDTWKDILARPSLKPMILTGLSYEVLMKISLHPDVAGVYRQSMRTGGLMTWPEIAAQSSVAKLLKGESVFIAPEASHMFFLDYYCSGAGRVFYISRTKLFPMWCSVIQTKGLPADFREQMNRKLSYFATTQQIIPSKRWASYHFDECMWQFKGYHSGNDILLLSSIMIAGSFLSVIVLFIEIMTFRYCPKCTMPWFFT